MNGKSMTSLKTDKFGIDAKYVREESMKYRNTEGLFGKCKE